MCCTPLYKQTFKIYGFLHNAWIAPNTLLISSTYAPYTLLVRSTYAPHRPKVSLLSPLKAEGRSAISASHTYHLRGSISSAALREKSDVSAGKGIKPLSALGMRHPITPKYPCKCLIIKESIWSQDKSDEVRSK